MALAPTLLPGLTAAQYTDLTPIQAQSLPSILSGRDLIAQAPTGSGKTVAFALGLLQRIDLAVVQTQAVVLCPTRELADQVAKEIRRLAIGMPNLKLVILCGGIPLRPQLASLAHPPHVVVGTPGRIDDLLSRDALKLDAVRTLVLDEADRMLDMGFVDDINKICGQMPIDRQSLLFSATFPDAIRGLAAKTLREPLIVTVDAEESQPNIEHEFYAVDTAQKPALLMQLLRELRRDTTVVFCNTRRDVDDVAAGLNQAGFSALALHGDMEQRDRDEVLVRFANHSCSVLIATDVAARGLDIKELGAVINYELPNQPDDYIHRVGRTGRMGHAGLSASLVSPRELARTAPIEARAGAPLNWRRAVMDHRLPPVEPAPMLTLCLDAGRTEKMRPGDILGALTGSAGLPASAIGKIDVFATRSYVAVARAQASTALSKLQAGKIKGKTVRVRKI